MNTSQNEKIFITVGTEKQKLLALKMISSSQGEKCRDVIVVSDCDLSGRLGSAGAFLKIISENYVCGDKILIINSGGMSKRCANYAIRGKAFARLEYENEEMFLFDAIIKSARKILDRIKSGVVVSCGDILVNTENVEFDETQNQLFAAKADIETGTRHGVMFMGENKKLSLFSHKEKREKLEELSREYNCESLLIDTGMVFFTEETVNRFLSAERKHGVNEKIQKNLMQISLYSDIIKLFAENTEQSEMSEIQKLFFDELGEIKADVCVTEGEFIHFGTVKESLENIHKFHSNKTSFISLNSFKDKTSSVASSSVIENTELFGECTIGENSFVCDITLNDKKIGDGTLLVGVRLNDGKYCAVVCPTDENPKTKVGDKELWQIPRFYKAESYDDAYDAFVNKSVGEKVSLEYIFENADSNYYCDRIQYISDMLSAKENENYLQMRKEIISAFFANRRSLPCLECKKDFVKIELPLRVNISGTWTDAMPYCTENGGAVINMAVTVDGEKPIAVIAKKTENKKITLSSDGAEHNFTFDENDDLLSDFNLHKAAFKVLGIDENTEIKTGFRLETAVFDVDKGSGLGTSSILLSGCIKAMSELLGISVSDEEIIKKVFVAEQLMKTGGGWQDQAGGITKGMKISVSEKGTEQNIEVKKITLSENFKNKFASSLFLVPTGQRHFGRFIVGDVAGRYLDKNEEAMSGFEKMKKLNSQVLLAIKNDDFDTFCSCLDEHFEILKMISHKISNEQIENIVAHLKTLCRAVSICGAGAGGYLLAVAKENVTKNDLQNLLNENFPFVKSRVKKIDLYE